jgi:hypothetical protein
MHLILDMPEGMVQQTLIYVNAFYVHLDGKNFIVLPMDFLVVGFKAKHTTW